MASSPDVLLVLQSIDRSLKQLVSMMARPSSSNASTGGRPAREIASDRDLDSPHGDPEVKFNKSPRDWAGANMKGRRFSECPPDYLDQLADLFDYLAEQAEEKNEVSPTSGKPTAPYKRKDAARARGWASRIRSGRHTQRQEPAMASGWAPADAADTWGASSGAAEPPSDDDIPF